ncbi:LysR family transcriptional regulator [Halioxenophilus sp. WMMB6]|uniref:LysR family transcriptional regulator n=1 Tax=Halioxenophilus sp. WMMB6 TaxID=3073815 RepID=UPI00295EF65C|nr:LysR family transcriptional regulator [Halioxenophilus sp. WMMB6]
MAISLQQLLTLEAVIRHGSIQAGAEHLHKTHPSVITSLKKLESDLGFPLFDRSGYRSRLTEAGRLFYQRAQALLEEMKSLEAYSQALAAEEAAELNIVIGDVTPQALVLERLRRFSERYPHARLNLLFENIGGPNERLLAGDADLIIHHIDKADPRYEYRDLCEVAIVPVVAAGFLQCPLTSTLRYTDLQDYTQCVIRDSAGVEAGASYFVLPDAHRITVGDQYTKREIIRQGIAWGHMPRFLIEGELASGQLLELTGDFIRGSRVQIVVARLSGREKSALLETLWQLLAGEE